MNRSRLHTAAFLGVPCAVRRKNSNPHAGINNVDHSNSNIAFDSSNRISNYQRTSGIRGTTASAILIRRARLP